VYVAAQRGIRWLLTDELSFTVLLTHTVALGKRLWGLYKATNEKSASAGSSESSNIAVPLEPETLINDEYERYKTRAEQIKGGHSDVIPDVNTTVVDLCLKVDNATQQLLAELNIPIEHVAQRGRAVVNVHFNRALHPHNKNTDIVVMWMDDKPFYFYTNTTNPNQRHLEAHYAMAKSSSFMEDHRYMGCDITVLLTYHGPTTTFAAGDDRCYGGIASSLDNDSTEKLQFVSAYPLGVVDIYCMLNEREDVLSHEMGHVFGAQHDIETRKLEFKHKQPSIPPKGDQHGMKGCSGANKEDCWRTIMSYSHSHLPGQHSIGYFSCAGQIVDGKSIGFNASNSTDGYGADNCSIISKNIEMVSNFGTPNPFVAKRRPAPYKP
jgi:Metallo-peptidase family M12